MFTGIVSQYSAIESVSEKNNQRRFLIPTQFDDLVAGESISVDGICLTVTEICDNKFYCDLSPETLDKTIAGSYQVGSPVNLERSLRYSDRLGGHFVSGHIDGRAVVKKVEKLDKFWHVAFESQEKNAIKYVVQKGSIAVNGVSLTVNNVDKAGFDVMLIPHTLMMTNLKYLSEGDLVNVEYDMLVKMVAKQVELVHAND